MGLHDPDHPGIAGPERIHGDGTIDDEPGRRSLAVSQADFHLEPAAGLIDHATRELEFLDRMGRGVFRQGHGLVVVHQVAQRIEHRWPRDHQPAARFLDGVEFLLPALHHRRRDFRHDHRSGRSVGHHLVTLRPLEKRHHPRPRLRRSYRSGLERSRLDYAGKPDRGLLRPCFAGRGKPGRRGESSRCHHPAEPSPGHRRHARRPGTPQVGRPDPESGRVPSRDPDRTRRNSSGPSDRHRTPLPAPSRLPRPWPARRRWSR